MSYYQRLGVDASASSEALRQAFRTRSKALHPDRTRLPVDQAAREFQQLCEAYDVLADPHQRHLYDAQLGSPTTTPSLASKPKPFESSTGKGIGERRPLSGGEWFALVLLAGALILSLIVGLGLAVFQGKEWQVAPVWMTSEQTQGSGHVLDGRVTDSRDPSQSTFDSRP